MFGIAFSTGATSCLRRSASLTTGMRIGYENMESVRWLQIGVCQVYKILRDEQGGMREYMNQKIPFTHACYSRDTSGVRDHRSGPLGL